MDQKNAKSLARSSDAFFRLLVCLFQDRLALFKKWLFRASGTEAEPLPDDESPEDDEREDDVRELSLPPYEL